CLLCSSLCFNKFSYSLLNLGNAVETAPALVIRWSQPDVAAILFDCFSVTSLLKISIAEVHNRNFKIRFELKRLVVFLNRLFVPPGPFIAGGQTVMRVRLLRPKVYVTLEHGDRLIVTARVRVS